MLLPDEVQSFNVLCSGTFSSNSILDHQLIMTKILKSCQYSIQQYPVVSVQNSFVK